MLLLLSQPVSDRLSRSLHVYEAKNMTKIKNKKKIKMKTTPSAVGRMCTFPELLSVSVKLCAARLLG